MKKNNKGFIQIILILVVIALVGGGMYYFGTFKNRPVLVSKTSSPALTLKIYIDTSMGFSFQYPETLSIKTEKELGTNTGENSIYLVLGENPNPSLQDAIIRIGHITTAPAFENVSVYFQFLQNIKLGTNENFNETNSSPVRLRSMSINGHDAVEIYDHDSSGDGNSFLSRQVTIKQNERSLISLNTIDRSNGVSLDLDFDQILSTFKFTE